MMNPLPTIGQDFSLVTREESHRSLTAVETPTSVFFFAQKEIDESKKDVIWCDHCNWPGHTKATCFKLIWDPPGHRLYTQQPSKNAPKKTCKDYNKVKKGQADVNMVEGGHGELSQAENSNPIFTPAQYAEIWKLRK